MPATYTQAHRALMLTPPAPLAKDDLLLVGFHGHEAISSLFAFHLDLMGENGKAVPFDQVLGKKATVQLGLPNVPPRFFNGIVSRIAQGRRDQDFTRYQMEIVPEAWLLTRSARSRIFQQVTVKEILAEVFAGFSVDLRLKGQYQSRDYCVQYRETDFNFASRLMEEEGIFYYFTHDAKNHVMVIADSPDVHPQLGDAIVYEELEGGERDDQRVFDWDKAQELRSGKFTLWDHSFELPHKHLDAEKTLQDSVTVGKVTHKLKVGPGEKLEIYDYPGEYAQRFDGVSPGGGDRASDIDKIFQDNTRTVGIRAEQEAAQALAIRGAGNVTAFVPGVRFKLARHFDADGPYLLTSVHHSAAVSSDYRSEGEAYSYQNSFGALPAGLPFRPARVSPKPVIHGTQTAVVVGPAGEEIFPDKYSRVKVKFHWDRSDHQHIDASCWVRVSTPWAGKHWGMIHIPRIGQEVVVAFEEGDPDRPLIVGSVYNADMMPPYDLPANKTQSGIQSRSSKGGGPPHFNELRFEDKKGSEQVFFHAEKDFVREVENNDTLTVGIPGDSLKEGNQASTIYKDRTATILHGNELLTVKEGNRTVEVTQGDDLHHVKTGNRTVNVDTGNDSHTIKTGNRSVEIGMGNDSLLIKMGNQTTKLNLGQSTTEAMQSITLKVGQSSLVIDQMGVTIKGMMISVEGQVQTSVKGLMTQINGDAMLTAKGGITMIN